jgi:hypothetical protein
MSRGFEGFFSHQGNSRRNDHGIFGPNGFDLGFIDQFIGTVGRGNRTFAGLSVPWAQSHARSQRWGYQGDYYAAAREDFRDFRDSGGRVPFPRVPGAGMGGFNAQRGFNPRQSQFFDQPMDGDVRLDSRGRVMLFREPDWGNRNGIDLFGLGERGGWRPVDPSTLSPEQQQQLQQQWNQQRGMPVPGTGWVERQELPPIAGQQPQQRFGADGGRNVLQAFERLNGRQQSDLLGSLERAGHLRGNPNDPSVLASALESGLRQNFPNINPSQTNPAEIANALVDMPGQIAARARDQQVPGRSSRPGGQAAGQPPQPGGGAGGGTPPRPATPPAPQMERGEHVAEFQRRAMTMVPEHRNRLVQGLRQGSRPDDGIAGTNTEAVRQDVIRRLNENRGQNPEVPANTNLRDLNRIMEQRGHRVGQAQGQPPQQAAARPFEPLDPRAAQEALRAGAVARERFLEYRAEAQRVIDRAAADRGPGARLQNFDPEGTAHLLEAREALERSGVAGGIDANNITVQPSSPMRGGGTEIAPGFRG